MRAAPVIALTILVASISLAAATHSASPCPGEVTPYRLGTETFYLLREPNGGIWLFQETNAHADLQRGGRAWYEFGSADVVDPCWDRDLANGDWVDPDRIIL